MRETIKKLCFAAATAAVTTLTSCVVKRTYDKYADNDVAKANLKNKIRKLNPFRRNY